MVALIHGVFSDVKIDSPEERDIILRYLKAKGKRVGDYVKEEFVVNALLRLQANPYIDKIVFTDSLNVPEKNIIDHQKIVKLSIADLLVTVCGRIIRGESLQNYQSEG
jgi:phosphoribosylpyrophosphate synthetase